MDLTEKTIGRELIFKGNIIRVRKDTVLLPNGKTSTREVVEHNGGVCVVPLTDRSEVVFVRQFRYPYGQVLLEIPAGKRDGDEDPLVCGKRELKEETGAEADEYIGLGELYPSPGYCGEVITMYLAKGLHFGQCSPDDDEFLLVEKIPLDTAVQMILNGEIKDSKTQAAILKTRLMLSK